MIASSSLHEAYLYGIETVYKEISRYNLDAFLLHFKDEKVKFITTNGKAITIFEVNISGKYPVGKKVIIDADNFELVVKMFKKSHAPVTISFDKNFVQFSDKENSIIIPQSRGDFPDYEEITPSPQIFLRNISHKEILKTLESTYSESKVYLKLLSQIDEFVPVITVGTKDKVFFQFTNVEFPITENLEICFDWNLLRNAFEQFSDFENVHLQFCGKESAVMLVAHNLTVLVMPFEDSEILICV